MSTKQPTPDSWAFWAVNPINPTFVDGPPGVNSTADGDWAICQTFGPDAEANAVLIAASRDLLAECEKALEFVTERLRTECAQWGAPFKTMRDFVDSHERVVGLRAAIAKAKGETC